MRTLGIALLVVSAAGVSGHVAAAQTPVPSPQGRVDCIPYDPAGLVLEDEGESGWLLARADGARFRRFDNRADAEAGLAVARAHTALCYIGRANTRRNHNEYVMEFWR